MDATIPAVNRRPGTLWTVLQFPLVRFLIAFLTIFIWIGCVQVAAKLSGIAPQSPLGAMIGMVIAVGVLVIYIFYVKLLQRREVVELAARGAQRHAARGILIGAALFGFTMLTLKLLGTCSYTGTDALSSLAYPFVGAFFAGIVEETVVRGLLFRILEESLGSWVALAISAVIFGLLHSFNPGASPVSTAAIALEAGVLLAAAYMYTRSLWFVMGLH